MVFVANVGFHRKGRQLRLSALRQARYMRNFTQGLTGSARDAQPNPVGASAWVDFGLYAAVWLLDQSIQLNAVVCRDLLAGIAARLKHRGAGRVVAQAGATNGKVTSLPKAAAVAAGSQTLALQTIGQTDVHSQASAGGSRQRQMPAPPGPGMRSRARTMSPPFTCARPQGRASSRASWWIGCEQGMQ